MDVYSQLLGVDDGVDPQTPLCTSASNSSDNSSIECEFSESTNSISRNHPSTMINLNSLIFHGVSAFVCVSSYKVGDCSMGKAHYKSDRCANNGTWELRKRRRRFVGVGDIFKDVVGI